VNKGEVVGGAIWVYVKWARYQIRDKQGCVDYLLMSQIKVMARAVHIVGTDMLLK